MSSRFTLLDLYLLINLKKFFVHLTYNYHCILTHNDNDLNLFCKSHVKRIVQSACV